MSQVFRDEIARRLQQDFLEGGIRFCSRGMNSYFSAFRLVMADLGTFWKEGDSCGLHLASGKGKAFEVYNYDRESSGVYGFH